MSLEFKRDNVLKIFICLLFLTIGVFGFATQVVAGTYYDMPCTENNVSTDCSSLYDNSGWTRVYCDVGAGGFCATTPCNPNGLDGISGTADDEDCGPACDLNACASQVENWRCNVWFEDGIWKRMWQKDADSGCSNGCVPASVQIEQPCPPDPDNPMKWDPISVSCVCSQEIEEVCQFHNVIIQKIDGTCECVQIDGPGVDGDECIMGSTDCGDGAEIFAFEEKLKRIENQKLYIAKNNRDNDIKWYSPIADALGYYNVANAQNLPYGGLLVLSHLAVNDNIPVQSRCFVVKCPCEPTKINTKCASANSSKIVEETIKCELSDNDDNCCPVGGCTNPVFDLEASNCRCKPPIGIAILPGINPGDPERRISQCAGIKIGVEGAPPNEIALILPADIPVGNPYGVCVKVLNGNDPSGCPVGSCFCPERCEKEITYEQVESCPLPSPTGRTRCNGTGCSIDKEMERYICEDNSDGPECTGRAKFWEALEGGNCGCCQQTGLVCDGVNIWRTFAGNKCDASSGTPQCVQANCPPSLVINCAPAQNSSITYCSGGVSCTLTTNYPGTCGGGTGGPIVGVGVCDPVSINVVCNGTCSNDNDPNGDPPDNPNDPCQPTWSCATGPCVCGVQYEVCSNNCNNEQTITSQSCAYEPFAVCENNSEVCLNGPLLGPPWHICFDGCTFEPIEQQCCVSDENCDPWSPVKCSSSGQQSRQCTDNCGQDIVENRCCVDSSNCGQWSVCSNGSQIRDCIDNCGNRAKDTRCCVDSSNCGQWSECLNGKKTRTCTDNCGSITIEEQFCPVNCIPQITCGEWGSCSGGTQTKTCQNTCAGEQTFSRCCVDSNNCSPWSACANGLRSRQCVDNCGYAVNEVESCDDQCQLQWTYTETPCVCGFKTVNGSNNCNSDTTTEVQTCAYEPVITCDPWGDWGQCISGFQTRIKSCNNSCTGDYQDSDSRCCVTEQNCGQWSECVNGQKTRTCTDNCSQPVTETQDCPPPQPETCTPVWTYTETPCVCGVKTVNGTNNCNSDTTSETQVCPYVDDPVCREWGQCINGSQEQVCDYQCQPDQSDYRCCQVCPDGTAIACGEICPPPEECTPVWTYTETPCVCGVKTINGTNNCNNDTTSEMQSCSDYESVVTYCDPWTPDPCQQGGQQTQTCYLSCGGDNTTPRDCPCTQTCPDGSVIACDQQCPICVPVWTYTETPCVCGFKTVNGSNNCNSDTTSETQVCPYVDDPVCGEWGQCINGSQEQVCDYQCQPDQINTRCCQICPDGTPIACGEICPPDPPEECVWTYTETPCVCGFKTVNGSNNCNSNTTSETQSCSDYESVVTYCDQWTPDPCQQGGQQTQTCYLSCGGDNTTPRNCPPLPPPPDYNHLECNGLDQCVFAPGAGDDQCRSDFNNNTCQNHNICTEDLQCIKVEGPGIDRCQNNSDCVSNIHKECNIQKQCVTMPGPGPQVCPDCEFLDTMHTECNRDNKCVVVYTTGEDVINVEDVCNSDDDCIPSHTICNYFDQCVVIDEAGEDECYLDADCKHTECGFSGGFCQCIEKSGSGISDCFEDTECLESPICQMENICLDGQCEPVPCEDPENCYDICSVAESCCPPGSHTECLDGQCLCQEGDGIDRCSFDSNCQYSGQCIFQQCVVLDEPGFGPDCFEDIDCQQNDPPYATDLEADSGSYCTGIPLAGIAYFSWKYNDLEGSPQHSYEIQITDDPSFADTPEVYGHGTISIPDGGTNTYSVKVLNQPTAPDGGYIRYGVPYYWRVRIQESDSDLWSDWTQYEGSFTYAYSHPAPVPEFSFLPLVPVINEEVQFINQTFFAPESSPTYLWTFGDGSTSTQINPIHIFTSLGNFTATLQVCDANGCCSTPEEDISVRNEASTELPRIREIPPY